MNSPGQVLSPIRVALLLILLHENQLPSFVELLHRLGGDIGQGLDGPLLDLLQ